MDGQPHLWDASCRGRWCPPPVWPAIGNWQERYAHCSPAQTHGGLHMWTHRVCVCGGEGERAKYKPASNMLTLM